MLVVTCLCVATWIERDPLLRGMAGLWIVSDAVTKADAAVVLGGGLEGRPFAAADLYRKGIVNRILIAQVADDSLVSIGVVSGSYRIKSSSADETWRTGRCNRNVWNGKQEYQR